MGSVSSIGRMATRSASGKIFSFVFAAVAVAMVLESSTSVPGSKCLWNNVVSTLAWRVLNQPRGISPRGRSLSRGREPASEGGGGGERVYDRAGVVRRCGAQGVERRRHRSHDQPGASIRQPHMNPGDGARLGVSERKGEQIRRRPAPAAHRATHREPAASEALRNTLAQGITPRNEDLVPSHCRGLLVAGGGGACEEQGVPEYGDAELPKGAKPAIPFGNLGTRHPETLYPATPNPTTPHGIILRAPTHRSNQ